MRQKIDLWAARPDLLDYVIEAYAGMQPTSDTNKVLRRVFVWEADGAVLMGNVQAFSEHLIERFGLVQSVGGVARTLHNLLIDLGERGKQAHKGRSYTGEHVGVYREPLAEQWAVEGLPGAKAAACLGWCHAAPGAHGQHGPENHLCNAQRGHEGHCQCAYCGVAFIPENP